jgi:hypothetical protein
LSIDFDYQEVAYLRQKKLFPNLKQPACHWCSVRICNPSIFVFSGRRQRRLRGGDEFAVPLVTRSNNTLCLLSYLYKIHCANLAHF